MKTDKTETMAWADMAETKYCELEHEKPELREATTELLLTCPDCKVEWSTLACRGHTTMAAFLISIGGNMDCFICKAELPARDRMKLEAL